MRKNGEVFGGFIEGPIRFPPSYRWNREADDKTAGDFVHVSDLEKCYCLRVHHHGSERDFQRQQSSGHHQSEDLRSLRTPSYTDRILTYSQPGRKHRLQWKHYNLCESAFGSDHRPVCAVLELEVDPGVIGFTSWSHASVSRASQEEEGVIPEIPPTAEEEDELLDGRPCMVTIELGQMVFDLEDGKDPTVIKEVVVLYPMIAEDPYSSQRTAWWLLSVRRRIRS